jgi:repressor LexA
MLTEQQTEILQFICKSIEGDGFVPSLKEIGDATGLSLTQARYEVLKIEKAGFIERRKLSARAIKVLRRPEMQAAA